MKKEDFINVLKKLKSAVSVSQGKLYRNISISNGKLFFVRESNSQENINIDELYQLYRENEYINTNIARNYITGRMFSPAVGILTSAGLYDRDGNKTEKIPADSTEKISKPTDIKKSSLLNKTKKLSDEARFFQALGCLLGDCVVSKTLNRNVSSKDIFLDSDYRKMRFPKDVESAVHKALVQLKSDLKFESKSLSHFIDGLVLNHPILGNRLVEFDEEQHFTPARLITMSALQGYSIQFSSTYISLLKSKSIFDEMLKKNRLSGLKFTTVPNFDGLLDSISNPKVKESGYIEPKKGFNYKGGRIAQRAHNDLLRDLAHLSEANRDLQPVLRFPKVMFENYYNSSFSRLNQEQLIFYIIKMIRDIYQIEITRIIH